MKSLVSAVSFLTILPVPSRFNETASSEDFALSFSFYPAVGLIIGCFCSLAYFLLHRRVPILLAAVFISALLTILTRGLHLDGLADLADGVGGGYTAERSLEIMKDSRIGTFGSLALVIAMLFKVAGLCALIEARHWYPILLIPMFSRLSMVLTAYKSPYARPEGGLAKSFLEHTTLQQPLAAAIFSVIVTLFVSPKFILFYAMGVIFCVTAIRHFSRRRLGGVTGDVLGATNELSEITLFSLLACLSRLH